MSRQHHVDLYDYFGFPYDWTGSAVHRDPLAAFGAGDPHLRSARAVVGYHVRAVGGDVGSAEDFLVEVPSWAIRYVAVRMGSGLVLVSPEWITGVSWEGRRFDVDLPTEALGGAPRYDPSRHLDRAYEARLYDHYRRPAYWERERRP